MTGFLSAAFVIVILVASICGTAIAFILCLLAGKGEAAIGWLIACLVSGGLFVLALGGV